MTVFQASRDEGDIHIGIDGGCNKWGSALTNHSVAAGGGLHASTVYAAASIVSDVLG